MKLLGTNVPGLRQHLFSVSLAVSMGTVAIIDAAKPRLKMGTGTIPLQELGDNNRLYSLSLGLDDNAKDRALRVEALDLWHRGVGHISARSLDILNMVEGSGLSCCGDGLACDACAIGQSAQQAHPKNSMYNAKFYFQLVFTDPMGPIAPATMGVYHFASKFTDAATRWRKYLSSRTKVMPSPRLSSSIRRLSFPADHASNAFARTRAGSMPTRSLRTTASRRESCMTSPPPRRRNRWVSRSATGRHWQGWCSASSRTRIYPSSRGVS